MYQSRTIFKGVLLSAAAVVVESKKSKDENEQLLCKPSELPIYTPEAITNTIAKNVQEEATPGSLEVAISSVRRQFTNIYYEIKAYERVGEQYIQESRENAEWLLKYLREEDNTTPKAGAIAIGGMTGLIFGLRGGLIKRTIYATTGALGMAAVCYPKEASEYSQAALVEARKYATIAYNFAYGGADTDEQVMVEGVQVTVDSENEIDPLEIITKAHDESSSKSCYCPLDTSSGPHDEMNGPPPEVTEPPPNPLLESCHENDS